MTFDITVKDLQQLILNFNQPQQGPFCLIDVREPHEWAISRIQGAQHIPLKQLALKIPDLNKHTKTVLYCRSGIRSQQALQLLQKAGFTDLHHLKDGILAWQKQIDPNMPVA